MLSKGHSQVSYWGPAEEIAGRCYRYVLNFEDPTQFNSLNHHLYSSHFLIIFREVVISYAKHPSAYLSMRADSGKVSPEDPVFCPSLLDQLEGAHSFCLSSIQNLV